MPIAPLPLDLPTRSYQTILVLCVMLVGDSLLLPGRTSSAWHVGWIRVLQPAQNQSEPTRGDLHNTSLPTKDKYVAGG